MQSGPDAFLGLNCLRSFRIPGSSIFMSGIGGYGFPLGCGMSDVSSLVKTDLYCLLRMLSPCDRSIRQRYIYIHVGPNGRFYGTKQLKRIRALY